MSTEEIITWIENLGPIRSWDQLSEDEADQLSSAMDELEGTSDLTEVQARRLYFSIESPLDGLGSQMFDIISEVPGHPFRWQLWDDRDESDDDILVQELKESAFEVGTHFEMGPLPVYNFNANPIQWLRDSLSVDMSSYEIQKLFIYALRNIGGTAIPLPPELDSEEGKDLLIRARSKVSEFAPKSQGLESLKANMLEIIESKLLSIGNPS